MKRTCFVLVSLLAITLLSCSALDNSAEDVNYPQANALNKEGLDFSTADATTGSAKLTSGVSWGVAAVGVGASKCSNELSFNFTTPPTGCTITKTEFCPGAVSVSKGAFTTQYVIIKCGSYSTQVSWTGSGCISTTYFSGLSAKIQCSISFCGNCVGGYYEYNQPVNMCNKSYSGGNMTHTYQCP